MAPSKPNSSVSAADFGGIAQASSTGVRAPYFQEGHYLVRVDSYRARTDEENDQRMYILNGTILARLSATGNEPGTPVGNVLKKGTFQGAKAAQMGQLKAYLVAMTGLKAELNDPEQAALTAAKILEQGLGDGKVIEIRAVNNKQGTYVTPTPVREEPVPAAEWVSVVDPRTLNAVFGAGNEKLALAKIQEILAAEAA